VVVDIAKRFCCRWILMDEWKRMRIDVGQMRISRHLGSRGSLEGGIERQRNFGEAIGECGREDKEEKENWRGGRHG